MQNLLLVLSGRLSRVLLCFGLNYFNLCRHYLEESIKYEVKRIDDGGITKGQEIVRVEGAKGKKKVVYETTTVEGVLQSRRVIREEIIQEPVDEIIAVGTYVYIPLTRGQGTACNIKGNISYNTSERIYHVPGGLYYNQTTINENYGERWFCSEAEARAAGWHRSYR